MDADDRPRLLKGMGFAVLFDATLFVLGVLIWWAVAVLAS